MSNSSYSVREEHYNVLTHGVGFIAAIVGLFFIVVQAKTMVAVSTSAVYCSTLIFMFLSSTAYHAVSQPSSKNRLKLLDHSAIYLLIAGTYTPILVLTIGGKLGVVSTILIWCFAIGGIVFKLLARNRYPKLSVATYLLMGWFALCLLYPLYQSMHLRGLGLIIAGGVCFSIGVLFYIAKNKPFTHAIWHVFVIAGCSCHYFSIYFYVI